MYQINKPTLSLNNQGLRVSLYSIIIDKIKKGNSLYSLLKFPPFFHVFYYQIVKGILIKT